MKIGIIGTGTMARGISQLFAQNGYKVIIKGRTETSLNNSLNQIKSNLDKSREKNFISEEVYLNSLKNIKTTLETENLSDCDLIIESVVENIDIKKNIFSDLDKICKKETIFATNTSSLSITDIAMSTSRPEKVIGVHFFNPVHAMKLVEIVNGMLTSKDIEYKMIELIKNVDKTPVIVSETPGFLVNRMMIPMINEAINMLNEGVATKEDIDTAMKLGANHPMGPLELADFIGNDICLAIMEVLYEEFKDSKYRPSPMLKKMVRAGLLGRKTKKGFYKY